MLSTRPEPGKLKLGDFGLFGGDRVDIHQNARLTPRSREVVVQRVVVERQGVRAVAGDFGVSEKTVRKWVSRFLAEGAQGLLDRSSRPHCSPRRTMAEM